MRDRVVDGFAAWAGGLRWASLPAEARTMVRKELLDFIGCLAAGHALAGREPWLGVFLDWGGKPEAHAAGGARLPAPTAALLNGYFGHVLEFDDTHDDAVLHAGASVIPAAMAACQRWGPVSGERFLEAVALGLEITCRLGIACRRSLAESGWIYTFKPFPTCRLTHPAITAALSLRERLGGDALASIPIEEVQVRLGAQAADIVGRDEPFRRHPVERVPAQFSVYWTVAVALRRGRVTPVELARDIPPQPDVAALIDRIQCHVLEETGAGRDVGGCVLEVRLPSRSEVVRVDHALGHPANPFTDGDLWAKFEANLQAAGAGGADVKALGRLIADLETQADAGALPQAVATLTSRSRETTQG